MSKEVLLKTLKKFESKPEVAKGFKENDKYTIRNDLNRADFEFSRLHSSSLVLKLYMSILEKTFKEFPLAYFQGMSDVASILVDVYFEDQAATFRANNKDLDLDLPKKIKVEDIKQEEAALFTRFLNENAELYERFKYSLINILEQKFMFFTNNEFEKYDEYNDIFIEMMKKKYKKNLEKIYSIKYMNHTLTFFKRLAGTREVIYKILNLILNSDESMLFSILAIYIDKAEFCNGAVPDDENASKYKIMEIKESDIKEILKAQESFLFYKESIKNAKRNNKRLLFLGIAFGCLATSILIQKWNENRNKDDS